MVSNSHPTKFAPVRHCHFISQALPHTGEELQGHFSVAGLKETKRNIHVNGSRSQYTNFTSHNHITHRNSMQLYICHIFTNTSTIL